jgi:hypothetical protein
MLMSLANACCKLGLGIGSLSVVVLSSGCNSLDDYERPTENQARLVIPTDTRPVQHATKAPRPVSGGTLLVTRSGQFAVASDQDLDAVTVVDLASGRVHGVVQLSPGDEPGRLVEDQNGIVHVALRRGGAIVAIDPAVPQLRDRRAVCGAPRGLAVTPNDTLTVACADGKLVTLPVAGGEPTRTLTLEPDLRDVIPSADGGVSVTRFKSAEVLRVDAAGNVARRDRARRVFGMHNVPMEGGGGDVFFTPTESRIEAFSPRVAWRTVAGGNGALVMVHQRSVEAEVKISAPTMSGSSYGGGGGGFSCGGIVQNAVTVVGADGGVANLTLASMPLPVDATLLPDNRTLLIVHAGPADFSAPRPFVDFPGEESSVPQPGGFDAGFGANTLSVVVVPDPGAPTPSDQVDPDPGCGGSGTLPITEPAVAVAYNPIQPLQVVVQTVQPSQLVIFDNINNPSVNGPRKVALSNPEETLDTGFELFHRDSGGGIACASCHPEGGEDGMAWRFSTTGVRRTQALDVGLEGTAPFHWDGELGGLGELMSEVFVARMGGVHESDARLGSLQRFLFALEPTAPIRDASDEAVARGKALFESAETQCAACHSGARFTNNRSYHVGTRSELALQVPSLVGIGYRAPFMHDGCAPTLAARFDPNCGGGEEHGRTASLGSEQVADLVAYLESL